jgi:hypothetical protein
MSTQTRPVSNAVAAQTNGAGAAAILAAGVGCFMLAVFAILGDRSAAFRLAFVFYTPTGPLSGVTTSAIAVWLLAWSVLRARWRGRNLPQPRINAIAFVLLLLSLLLTFPPIANLF